MNAPTKVTSAAPHLCRDCKFAKRGFMDIVFMFGWRWAKCMHPTAAYSDKGIEALVTGYANPVEQFFCVTQRKHECGRDGKYWEPR